MPHKNDHGFTLLEALVVLAIVAAVLAFTPTVFSLGQRALYLVSVADQRNRENLALGVFDEHLAVAQQIYETGPNGIATLQFYGGEDRLGFVTEFSSAPYGGGLYSAEVAIDLAPSYAILLLSPHLKQSATALRSRNPLARAQRLAFRYYGTDQAGTKSWQPTWVNRKQLPELIAYSVVRDGEMSDALRIVALRLSR